MTTFELPWSKLYLADTQFFASDKEESAYALQWHSAGSTLFIMIKDKPEIDLRLEREIVDIFFQDPAAEAKTAVVSLTMLASRPLEWAKGTTFDPMLDDRKTICIQLEIGTGQRLSSYKILVAWMTRNVNTGEAMSMNVEKATQLWDSHSSEIMELSDDGEDDAPIIAHNTEHPVILHSAFGRLRQRDIDRLQPGVWANDEIVTFGLNYAMHIVREKHQDRKFHIMSTHFYHRLLQFGPESITKRKTKRNLFNHEFILVPAHQNSHWFLVVIDKPEMALKGNSKANPAGDTHKPGIYVMDSLQHGHPTNLFENVMEFLSLHAVKMGRDLDTKKFRNHVVQVPQQLGWDNCGFFMLHFAQVFMEDPGRCRDIIQSKKNKHLVRVWGNPVKKREELARIVEGLLEAKK